jgi:hypothetical protein
MSLQYDGDAERMAPKAAIKVREYCLKNPEFDINDPDDVIRALQNIYDLSNSEADELGEYVLDLL